MRSYWGFKKSATVHDLMHHARSLKKLKWVSHSTDMMRNKDKPDTPRRNGGPKGGNDNHVKRCSSSSLSSSLRTIPGTSTARQPCRYGLNCTRTHQISTLWYLNDDNRLRTILQIRACRESPGHSPSRQSTSATRDAN